MYAWGWTILGLSGSRKGYKQLNGHRFICTFDGEPIQETEETESIAARQGSAKHEAGSPR